MPEESKKHAPAKTWRGLSKQHGIRGATQKKCKAWIANLYQTKKPGTPFTLKQMCDGAGLDSENVRDYGRAVTFLAHERETFKVVLMEVLNSPNYDKYRDKYNDEQMYRMIVDNAVANNIYPVWSDSDDDHKYKLFDLKSYCWLMEHRMKAIRKEIEHKAPTMSVMRAKLPSVKQLYAPEQLPPSDGLLKLPGSIECEICHLIFESQAMFAEHYSTVHKKVP